MSQTVKEISELAQKAGRRELEVLERSLIADTRKGVRDALRRAWARVEAEEAEVRRLEGLYGFERELAASHGGGVVVGLDEVGRGSLAGPLAVGAVVLDASGMIAGLNDSKQVPPAQRERIAANIKQKARAWAVCYVSPAFIDAHGMVASLRKAFREAMQAIEDQGVHPDIALLDGNPLNFDEREVNVVKGDAQCASIAAASIVAKVERDALMCDYAREYPGYHLDECKGYASSSHIEAIRSAGLTPIHRASFCTAFTQETLF